MNLKSSPSDPACDINITFTCLPSTLFSSVAIFKSFKLFGDTLLSPVIIIYFAGLNSSSSDCFSFIETASILFVGGVSNSEFIPSARVKPNSSNASAIGITPPSIYCEYTKTTPVEFIILSQTLLIFPLYLPSSFGEKILPYFSVL